MDESNREGRHGLPSYLLGDGGTDIDRFFDALGNNRRRHILLYLSDIDHADLEQLAAYVARREGVENDEEVVNRIRLDLYHNQLPRLGSHGFISYDRRTDEVRLDPLPEALERILDLAYELEEERSVR